MPVAAADLPLPAEISAPAGCLEQPVCARLRTLIRFQATRCSSSRCGSDAAATVIRRPRRAFRRGVPQGEIWRRMKMVERQVLNMIQRSRVRFPLVAPPVECGADRLGLELRSPCHVPQDGRRLIYPLASSEMEGALPEEEIAGAEEWYHPPGGSNEEENDDFVEICQMQVNLSKKNNQK